MNKHPAQESLTVEDLKMHVLVFMDGKHWIAQGLEHDIAAQGESPKEAINLFGQMVLAEVRYDRRHSLTPLARIGKAPTRYWERMRGGEHVRLRRQDRIGRDDDTGSVVDVALEQSDFVLV